jgi:hypothetical protein
MKRTLPWWAALLAALPLLAGPLLAGCTSSAVAEPAGAPPPHDDFVLPADAYAFTVPETSRIDLARQLLAGRCMERFGYAFDANAAREVIDRGGRATVADLGYYGNERRYGVTDPAIATRYGYHLVSHVTGTAVAVDADAAPGLGRLSATMKTVLSGCAREAADALSTDGVLGEADAVADLGGQSYRDSFADPAVVAAFHRWSVCMRGEGYPYRTPREAGAEFDVNSATVPPREIAAAEADAGCKQRTQLVGVWHGYEVAVQDARIKADPATFQRAKEAHDVRMKRVADVLAG